MKKRYVLILAISVLLVSVLSSCSNSYSSSDTPEPKNEHEWALYDYAFELGQEDAIWEIESVAGFEEYIQVDEIEQIIYSYYDKELADDIMDSLCDCPKVDSKTIVRNAADKLTIGE